MRSSTTAICWLLILAFPTSIHAQTKSPHEIYKAPREFVQEFYDWYVPKALKDHAGPAWELALKYKSSVFSPEVLRALKEDSAAQTKAAGEIVGLDFDPFLNSQDPDERYEVGKVTQKGDRYWVEIYAARSGKKSEKPDVMPELVRKDGRYLFVNFHYPDGSDLLSTLRVLRESRQKHPH